MLGLILSIMYQLQLLLTQHWQLTTYFQEFINLNTLLYKLKYVCNFIIFFKLCTSNLSLNNLQSNLFTASPLYNPAFCLWMYIRRISLQFSACTMFLRTRTNSAIHVLLSRFYLDFIQILSRFYPDFIQILSRFYPDFL